MVQAVVDGIGVQRIRQHHIGDAVRLIRDKNRRFQSGEMVGAESFAAETLDSGLN